jgi:hypothetical protein
LFPSAFFDKALLFDGGSIWLPSLHVKGYFLSCYYLSILHQKAWVCDAVWYGMCVGGGSF